MLPYKYLRVSIVFQKLASYKYLIIELVLTLGSIIRCLILYTNVYFQSR